MNVSRRRTGLAAALTAALLCTAPAPAFAGSDRKGAEQCDYPAVVPGYAHALHPEGITWDPTRHAFLVGSVRHGTISIVSPDGSARTLASDPSIYTTVGVHVDVERRRIVAAFADGGVGDQTEPDPAKRRTGIGIFDLDTGRTEHVVDLAVGSGHLADDLTFDDEGNIYITDALSDVIYRVDPSGTASVFAEDPRFAGVGTGVDGIVWHPDGYLLVGHYASGSLFRVTTRGRPEITKVELDQPQVGIDGLALRPDGTMIAVTNNLAAPTGVDGVSVLQPDHDWSEARQISRTAPWPDVNPSTVAVSECGSYVVSGQLGILLSGAGTSDIFTLHRL